MSVYVHLLSDDLPTPDFGYAMGTNPDETSRNAEAAIGTETAQIRGKAS